MAPKFRRPDSAPRAAIPRSANPGRAAENLDVLGFALADDEMARIAALKHPDGKVVDPFGRVSAWDA